MIMHLFGDATQKPQSRCSLLPPKKDVVDRTDEREQEGAARGVHQPYLFTNLILNLGRRGACPGTGCSQIFTHPPHPFQTYTQHILDTMGSGGALDVAYSATASLAVRRNDSAAPARWATPFRQRIPGGSVRPTTSVENALSTGVGRSTWGDPLAPSSPNLPSCLKPVIVLQ